MSEIVKKLEEYAAISASGQPIYVNISHILREAIAALQPGGERERWYIGTMNDGLFIINTKPQPAPVDYPFHDRGDGPTLVIPVSALGSERANEIVAAHNKAVEALLRAPVAVTAASVKRILLDTLEVQVHPNDPKDVPGISDDSLNEAADAIIAALAAEVG